MDYMKIKSYLSYFIENININRINILMGWIMY